MKQWEHKKISDKLARFYHRNVWGARDIPQLGRVVSLGRNGIRVWERDSGRCLSWRVPCVKKGMKTLAAARVFSISPVGEYVFLHDQAIWRLPLESLGADICIADVPEDYHLLKLADDGDTVAAYAVYPHRRLHVYSLRSGATIWSARMGFDSIQFSPDSKLLLDEYLQACQSGSDVLQFGVHRLSDDKCLLMEERTYWGGLLCFSPDSSAVLYGEKGKKARYIYPLGEEQEKMQPQITGTLNPDSPPPLHRSFKQVKAEFGHWETDRQP